MVTFRRLQALGNSTVRVISMEAPETPPPGHVRVRGMLSGISHGTELNLYRGSAPFATKTFDPELRAFVPREGPAATAYPMGLGYEYVGRVEAVGEGVDAELIGRLGHAAANHGDLADVGADWFTPLPDGIQPEDAIFLALSAVAMYAVHDACIALGDNVAIFGMGVIGLLAVKLAKLSGAGTVVAVDPLANRRSAATEFGADLVIDPGDGDPGLEVKRRVGGVDCAIEASGLSQAVHQAIRSVAKCGRVVTLGYYQGEAHGLYLGEEWHHNRPTMISSMGVWDCPHRRAPLWDRPRVLAHLLRLMERSEIVPSKLLTHRFPLDRAGDAYSLADSSPDLCIKVAIEY